jgi:hypothetical protein
VAYASRISGECGVKYTSSPVAAGVMDPNGAILAAIRGKFTS